MKRKHKTYSRPKRPFDKDRLVEEAQIKKDFGLKNKKEIWKADAKIKSMRTKAKKLIGADAKKQASLFEQLNKIGLKVNSIADILALTKEDYLQRRLQTILVKKGLTTTMKTARQFISHKKVLVDGRVVDSPSYVVKVALEDKIGLKPRKAKKKIEVAPVEEVKEEAEEIKDE